MGKFTLNGRFTMAGILEDIHPALKCLWDLENELRSAAQNAIFLRNDEAKKHMEEARRHYQEALQAIKAGVGSKTAQSREDATPPKSELPPSSSPPTSRHSDDQTP
jgi:hypothetical protein